MKSRFDKLAWRQKHIVLGAAVFILAWIIYTQAVSLTVKLSAQCDELQMKIDSAENISAEMRVLENELAQYGAPAGDTSYVSHEQLLDLVSSYCGRRELVLREFPPAMYYQRDSWNINVHRVTVQGSYIELVRLLEFLQQSDKGKIVSADFFSKVDNKTKARSLLATIYVQCISENPSS